MNTWMVFASNKRKANVDMNTKSVNDEKNKILSLDGWICLDCGEYKPSIS